MSFIAPATVPNSARDEVASGGPPPALTAAGDTYYRALLSLVSLQMTECKLLDVYIDHARTMCGAKNAGGLRLALCGIRTTARDLMRKAAALEAAHWPTVDEQFDADLKFINDGDLDAAKLAYE